MKFQCEKLDTIVIIIADKEHAKVNSHGILKKL